MKEPPPLPKKPFWKRVKAGYNNFALKTSKAIDRVYKKADNAMKRKPKLENFYKKFEEKSMSLNKSVAKKLPSKRNRISVLGVLAPDEEDPTYMNGEAPLDFQQ